MSNTRTALLADEILARLQDTTGGHCARIDFLERAEAIDLCRFMKEQSSNQQIVTSVLVPHAETGQHDKLFITTDEAIEIRNRKLARLCLFVPSDLVDAAYSSLANSFAFIDGRALYESALQSVIKELSSTAQHVIRFVSRGTLQASYEQRLDFAVTALNAENDDLLGLELWRVGLIADARPDFTNFLISNRSCTLVLSHPTRPDATSRERIQSLKVDKITASELSRFFKGRAMNDVQTWSRALAEQGSLTFDCWIFPEKDHSDIRSVKMRSFISAKGDVERFCRLIQPDSTNGSLKAICGPKKTMAAKWECEPLEPRNLHSWSVRIVPSGRENEFDEDSDFIEPRIPIVPGKRRSATIKLDIEEDEIPKCPVCVRIAPLDATGNEVYNEESGELIYYTSTEFFLVNEGYEDPAITQRERHSTVPTLSYGRIEIAMGLKDGQALDEEMQPQWMYKDLAYFSLTYPNRNMLSLGLSNTLVELENLVRDNPRSGGCFTLNVDELRPIEIDAITPYALRENSTEAWSAFWKMRETFFGKLKKDKLRDLMETVDWTPDFAATALRYAQAYRELLTTLMQSGCAGTELLEALSIDSLLVNVVGKGDIPEEAVVVLPTHPLRAAWFAGYTQLLHDWETRLLAIPKRDRGHRIDLAVLRLLVPTNVPAFAFHAASKKPFLFFQNARFFHGVALPAKVEDPRRRYSDIAYILGCGSDQSSIGDIQPDHLTEHLERFYASHPYAKTLITTLVNPDRGDFFAQAVKKFLDDEMAVEDQEDIRSAPSFQITSFMPNEHKNALKSLERLVQRADQQHDRVTDFFLPGLSTSVRPLSQLARKAPEAHLALVTDLTQSVIVVPKNPPEVRTEISSFFLYGLITRFISQLTKDDRGLLWLHRIVPEGLKKPEPHPVGARYNETLVDLHQAMLNAGGYLAYRRTDAYPVLEVRIDTERGQLLEHLHTNTNWVITMDRFFALDYYDSPNEPELKHLAQKYVLDYSPESIEGFGHRMMVTTAWHEEIEALLGQAMMELGFSSVDQSVSHLLHYLKTISGRLALQALESPTSASVAVGLGVVTAWLEQKGRLKEAILVPVDIYPRLFSQDGSGKSQRGERRCDLVLISLKRNIVDAIFIEVKWRRGQVPLQELATDMALQMESSAQALKKRFFDDERVDGMLQRSYLANVLRFYFERSRRYKLFNREAEKSFMEQLARLEKTGLDFRPTYEGYIVNLEGPQRPKPILIDTQGEKARVTVLTAHDFADTHTVELASMIGSTIYERETLPGMNEEASEDDDTLVPDSTDSTVPGISSLLEEVGVPSSRENVVENRKSLEPDILQANRHIDDNLLDEQNEASSGEISIPLGEASSGTVAWKPSIKGSPHLFILGIPGQGKSWTITRILNTLSRQAIPSLVLDFHGQFADPQGSFVQQIQPIVIDAAQGLPFSPFECTRENGAGGWQATSYALAEIFAYVTGMGTMQRDVIYTALQDAYKAHGFEDEDAEDLEYPTPREVIRRIEQKEQARHINNVAARCRPLLEMNLFRPEKDGPDLLSSVRGGLVIDLHNLYAEELQIAAGAFVLRKLYKDMFRWGNAERLRLAIVLDEAHRLAKDVTLPKIMKEGRKFGIATVVASQGINDFHQDILGNAGTKVIFRVNYPDSKKVAGFIRGRPGQDVASHIEQLAVGTAYVQTPDMPFGSVVRMYPLDQL
jgi:DNA phosphorothioation-dependent restriction protein DptH